MEQKKHSGGGHFKKNTARENHRSFLTRKWTPKLMSKLLETETILHVLSGSASVPTEVQDNADPPDVVQDTVSVATSPAEPDAAEVTIADSQSPAQPTEQATGSTVPGPFQSAEEFAVSRCTDSANGERFEKKFAGKVIHSDNFGWLVWDGQRFAKDSKAARESAKEIASDILGEIKPLVGTVDPADPNTASLYQNNVTALNKWAKASANTRGIENILTEAKSTSGINGNALEFDADPWMLNCQNGTLDLRTGQLLTHSPHHLITKLAPIAYDPEAKCPRWNQFLLEVFLWDQEVVKYVKRALAYSLTGETSWQAWFLLQGRGENGKSRFADVLRHVLGEDFCHEIDPEELCQQKWAKHTTERASLRGVRYLTSEETDEGRQLAESFIKALTGEGKIRARFMRQDSFEFQPVCKLWLSTNNLPVVSDTSHGFWRRVRMIPFNACFANSPNRDPNLSKKLADEAPGILTELVRYTQLVHQEGEGTIPSKIEDAGAKYRETSDLLGEFLAEYTTASNLNARVPKKDLYEVYQSTSVGYSLPQTQFNARLKARGIQSVHTRTGYVWVGLTLIDREAAGGDECDPSDA